VAIRSAVEAEACRRGYLITGAARHLERDNEALRTFDEVGRRPREQLPAASEQAHRFERAKVHLSTWVAEVAAPAIGTRRAAPAGLAGAASRLTAAVLQLRPLASAALAARWRGRSVRPAPTPLKAV
jgi:CHASE3 domain sensor protein